MRGAIPPLPNTSSWRGAWLSTGTTLPLLMPLIAREDFSASVRTESFKPYLYFIKIILMILLQKIITKAARIRVFMSIDTCQCPL
jgi:hypothetical protein